MCQGRPRKLFSPLWKSCEARACPFMCVKDLITPFKPPGKHSEARTGLLKWQGKSRKQFSPL